jgi:hypothetical protein
VDSETHVLSLHCVINQSSKCMFWELMPISNTDDWIRYLKSVLYWEWPLIIHVRAYEKEVAEQQDFEVAEDDQQEDVQQQDVQGGGSTIPQGMTDEGESIPSVVNQLEREDEEVAALDEEDDFDEPMPQDSMSNDFEHLAIRKGVQQPWDYRKNEIIRGATYASINDVNEAIKC